MNAATVDMARVALAALGIEDGPLREVVDYLSAPPTNTAEGATRVRPPRVASPIIFRAEKDGPEFEVSPCSGAHRAYWIGGYIVLSCSKCTKTMRRVETGVTS